MIYLARFLVLVALVLLSSKFSDSFNWYWELTIYIVLFAIADFAITKVFRKNTGKVSKGSR